MKSHYMRELIIFYVERELAVQGAYLFDALGEFNSSLSEYEFYLKFLTVDSNNNVFDWFIPQKTIEEIIKKKISNNHSFSKEAAGIILKIKQGGELSDVEVASFQKGEKLYNVLVENKKFLIIDSFEIDFTIKDNRVIPLFNKVARFYSSSFKEEPGRFNYIEGGYDIDAAFDGNPDAYWNID